MGEIWDGEFGDSGNARCFHASGISRCGSPARRSSVRILRDAPVLSDLRPVDPPLFARQLSRRLPVITPLRSDLIDGRAEFHLGGFGILAPF